MSALGDVRAELADALAGGLWEVHAAALDAVSGPCLVIMSGTREPLALGCNYTTRPVVLCIAGRVDLGASIDTLDEQEEWALSRLPWALERVEDERQTAIGGVDYLTRRVITRTTVTVKHDG